MSHCRLLVAVSGGGDSVAMACALAELAPTYSLDLILAHFNHRTRTLEEHVADHDSVRMLADRLGIPLIYGAAEASPDPNVVGIRGGLEAFARELRYNFLLSAARATGAEYCAVAHNRDDQIETIAMRLLSGVQSSLLSGIPVRREIEGVAFIRPVLSVSGGSLRTYARQRGVAWREDRSNEDGAFRRNLTRNQILPASRSRWPELDEDILLISASFADRLARDARAASKIAVADRAGKTIIDASKFYAEAPRVRLSFLYRVLQERGLISRRNRPSHKFFAPLLRERHAHNGVILEGRGIRFVASGPHITLSRMEKSS